MIPIDYVCFVNQTGYAQSAISNIMALHESGKYDVRINCVHTIQRAGFSDYTYNQLTSMSKKVQNGRAYQVFHTIPDMHRRVDNRLKKTIGFGIFEAFKPPAKWVSVLNQNDAVICPSEFNSRIFAKQGVSRPIFHIPHCIDTSKFNADVSPMYQYDKFSFLFIGTWRERKGWPLMIEAFCKAFDERDDVQLVIKTDKVERAKRDVEKKLFEIGARNVSILFESEVFDTSRMPSFYKSFDCVVSPTLGEGFGLTSVEAMAVGVPVVVSNCSGCSDYADAERCFPLTPSGFLHEPILDNIPQFSEQRWPRIKIDDIASSMLHIVDNYSDAEQRAKKAFDFVHQKYDYDSFVRNFDSMIESVYGVSTS